MGWECATQECRISRLLAMAWKGVAITAAARGVHLPLPEHIPGARRQPTCGSCGAQGR